MGPSTTTLLTGRTLEPTPTHPTWQARLCNCEHAGPKCSPIKNRNGRMQNKNMRLLVISGLFIWRMFFFHASMLVFCFFVVTRPGSCFRRAAVHRQQLSKVWLGLSPRLLFLLFLLPCMIVSVFVCLLVHVGFVKRLDVVSLVLDNLVLHFRPLH